jgi:hypothetical protein
VVYMIYFNSLDEIGTVVFTFHLDSHREWFVVKSGGKNLLVECFDGSFTVVSHDSLTIYVKDLESKLNTLRRVQNMF